MIESILIPFLTIGLAELGDKSQLAVLNLATRTKNHLFLLLGVVLAFVLVDGTAILFGGWLTNLMPTSLLKVVSGMLFIIFGILSFRKSEEELVESNHNSRVFLSSFSLIFLSEWGDKTQLSAALFATKYQPLFVFIGVILSLALLSLVAIYIGKYLFAKVDKKLINMASGLLFIVLGISFLLSR